MLAISKPNHHVVEWYTGPATSDAATTVAVAFANAVSFFEAELCDKASDRAWIKAQTSIQDVHLVVQQAQNSYKSTSQRSSKARKWVDALASTVSQYGAVLDVMSNADPMHTGLVWGAMKFVFVGVLQHSELVVELAKALVKIGRVLSRVQMDLVLYQTTWMQDTVARLYAYILLFLQKAVKWYNGGRLRRMVSSVVQPYKLSFAETVNEIHACLDEADAVARTANRAEVRGLSLALTDLAKQQTISQQQSQQHLQSMQTRLNEIQISSQRSELMLRQVVQNAIERKTMLHIIDLETSEMRLHANNLQIGGIIDRIRPENTAEDIFKQYDGSAKARCSWQQPSRDTAVIVQRLKSWFSVPGSSSLRVEVGSRAMGRASDLVYTVIKVLKSTTFPAFWHIRSPRSAVACSAGSIFEALIFQALQHDPGLALKHRQLRNAAPFSEPHTIQELCDLAVLIFSGISQCFIVIETQDWLKQPGEEDQITRDLFGSLNSFFLRLSEEGTIIKMLIVGWNTKLTSLPENSRYSQSQVIMGPPLPVSRQMHRYLASNLAGSAGGRQGSRQFKPRLSSG